MYLTDPDTDNCDSECGSITALNIVYHVPCRLQCVLPDFAGLMQDIDGFALRDCALLQEYVLLGHVAAMPSTLQ